MNIITLDELKVLLAGQQGLCVSLFMPTHRRGRETEQDPIRFKNLLRQAEEHLQSKGLRSPEAREMLKPAQRLLNDPVFWRHQSDGLAVFVSSEGCRHYSLPLLFEELAVISDRFHLKPILPLFTGDGHFYILALSQKQVRLLEGTRYTVDEIDLEGMSTSIAEVLQYERFEKQLQFHTGTAGGGGDARRCFMVMIQVMKIKAEFSGGSKDLIMNYPACWQVSNPLSYWQASSTSFHHTKRLTHIPIF